MSNQLISGEYFYKGRINYFLVKCHIYQGNKQIYNIYNQANGKWIKCETGTTCCFLGTWGWLKKATCKLATNSAARIQTFCGDLGVCLSTASLVPALSKQCPACPESKHSAGQISAASSALTANRRVQSHGQFAKGVERISSKTLFLHFHT